MIFRDVGGSRQPLGPFLRISRILVILKARPVQKSTCFLGQNTATNTFSAVLYFDCFFECFCYRIFVILGARRLHFSSYLCVLLGARGL